MQNNKNLLKSGTSVRTQKGFSLIETLIGMVIIGMIGIVILGSLAASVKANTVNSTLTKAESLARTQLEYIQNQAYNATNTGTIHPPAYSSISLPSGYGFGTSVADMVTRIDSSGNSVTTDDGLQRITVSVQYDNKIIYTLTDYKVNR